MAELLKSGKSKDFDVILMVAEGNKQRVMGFTFSFFFPKTRFAYLDYVASAPERRKRGYGAALYESTREILLAKKCRGLFMDVPTDEKEKLKEISRLSINQKRLAFYERFGARPIIHTLYDNLSTKANQGYLTFLVFDDLETGRPLRKSELRQSIKQILAIKGPMDATDQKLKQIIYSVNEDPVQLRMPRYIKSELVVNKNNLSYTPIDIVSSGDANHIHHLKEKGYVERPARIHAILKGLQGITIREHKCKHFGEKYITEIHDPKMVHYLKEAETHLRPNQLLYPNVFPIRQPNRIPKTWDTRVGYYCMDTFTPVTSNCYKAAINAVDTALTGAELVLKGAPLCYALCRPPGHHAERKTFGGFCYFNNAAIAAHYLAKHGKVAFLDIDYHHGNGSQDIFYQRDDVYFISIHGHPRQAYPYFAGYRDESGEGDGKGFNKNFPLYPNTSDDTYCETLSSALKLLEKFNPAYLVISLGFDIMAGDPTGTFEITGKGMFRIGTKIRSLRKPTLIVQEGGYSLRNLRFGAHEFFTGIAQEPPSHT